MLKVSESAGHVREGIDPAHGTGLAQGSHSDANDGQCIEVASAHGVTVGTQPTRRRNH